MKRGAAEEEAREEEGRWKGTAERLPHTSLPQISQYRSLSVPMRGIDGVTRGQVEKHGEQLEEEVEEEEQEAEEGEQEEQKEQEQEQGVQEEFNPGLSTSVASFTVCASPLPPSPVTTPMAGTITKEPIKAALLEGQPEITSSLSSLSPPSSSSSLQQIYLEASKRLEELRRRKEAIAWVNSGSSSSDITHMPVAATEQQHQTLEQQKQQHPSSFQQEGGDRGEKMSESYLNELMQRQGQGEEGRVGKREGQRHEGVGDWLFPISEEDCLDESEQEMYINGSSSSSSGISGISGSGGGPSLLSVERAGE